MEELNGYFGKYNIRVYTYKELAMIISTTLSIGKPEKFFSFPLFPTPRVFGQLKGIWDEILAEKALKKEINRLLKDFKTLGSLLLKVKTLDELDQIVEDNFNRYLILKIQLYSLLEFKLENTLTKENFWHEFLDLYKRGCEEISSLFKDTAPKFLSQDKAELLISALEGAVLYSTNLLEAIIYGDLKNTKTIEETWALFNKADLLLFSSFLVLNREIKRYRKESLSLIAEKADNYINEIEDIILSNNFEFEEAKDTIPLDEYLKTHNI